MTISPALLEGYVSAAGKISRVAMGSVTTAVSKTYRVPEETSQDYHVEGMPFGTRWSHMPVYTGFPERACIVVGVMK